MLNTLPSREKKIPQAQDINTLADAISAYNIIIERMDDGRDTIPHNHAITPKDIFENTPFSNKYHMQKPYIKIACTKYET